MTSLAISNSLDKITELGSQNGTRTVESGTILFVVRGMSLKSEFRVGVAQRTVAFNQDLKAIIPDRDLLPNFLALYLQFLEPTVLKLVDEAGHGTGRLPTDRIAAIEVPVPPLAEQRAIATALSDMDTLIAAQQKLISKKRDVKTATMQLLLTGRKRLPGFGTGLDDILTDVGHFPADWPLETIRSLDPIVTSGSRGWARFYAESGAVFVRITNLSRTSIYLDERDLKYVRLPNLVSEGQRTALQDGDLLISITADVGIVGLVDSRILKPAYINQHLALVRLDPELVDSRFVTYFLSSKSGQNQFKGCTDQGAKGGMNLEAVGRLKIPMAPLREQKAIAEVLSDMDAEITTLEARLAKLRDIKLGMMQELLTGRTRLV